jgi:hypothetical protein
MNRRTFLTALPAGAVAAAAGVEAARATQVFEAPILEWERRYSVPFLPYEPDKRGWRKFPEMGDEHNSASVQRELKRVKSNEPLDPMSDEYAAYVSAHNATVRALFRA